MARRAEAHLEARREETGAAAEAETLSELNVGGLVLQGVPVLLDPESPRPLQWLTTAQETFGSNCKAHDESPREGT